MRELENQIAFVEKFDHSKGKFENNAQIAKAYTILKRFVRRWVLQRRLNDDANAEV